MNIDNLKRIGRIIHSVFFVTMFGLTGGIICYFLGFFLVYYFFPPWSHTEIDMEGRRFEEIVAVDVTRYLSVDEAEIELFFVQADGTLFSYDLNNWKSVEAVTFENRNKAYARSITSCNEFQETPPMVFFQKMKQTVSISLWDSYYTSKYYCFVLDEDGKLSQWGRTFTFEIFLYFSSGLFVVGFILSGLIGWRRLKKRKRQNDLFSQI